VPSTYVLARAGTQTLGGFGKPCSLGEFGKPCSDRLRSASPDLNQPVPSISRDLESKRGIWWSVSLKKTMSMHLIFRHGRGTPQLPESAGGHLENGRPVERSGSCNSSLVDRSAHSSNTPRAERPQAVLPLLPPKTLLTKSVFGGSKAPDASHPSPLTEHGKEEDTKSGTSSTLQAELKAWKVDGFEETMRGFSQLAPLVLLCALCVDVDVNEPSATGDAEC
jgi:hypothetical protein